VAFFGAGIWAGAGAPPGPGARGDGEAEFLAAGMSVIAGQIGAGGG